MLSNIIAWAGAVVSLLFAVGFFWVTIKEAEEQDGVWVTTGFALGVFALLVAWIIAKGAGL